MYVLGLNHGEMNSSAALYHKGQIIAAAPEERFNRNKKSKAFPQQAIQFCLDFAGIRPKISIPGEDNPDFQFDWNREYNWLDLFGIESPGLTSSLAAQRRHILYADFI